MAIRKELLFDSKINELRRELYRLIDNERLDSGNVLKISRELDELILQHYKKTANRK